MTFAKIRIQATLEVKTGMHIGGGDSFAAIGAIDKTVIKDPLTKLPLIPGSSLKGKMRSLLAKQFNTTPAKSYNDDNERIKRLFGSSDPVQVGRLIFRDTVLSNEKQLRERGAQTITEVKSENSINRVTSEANPRQIERVIRGSEFDFSLVYEITDDIQDGQDGQRIERSEDEIREDIETIVTGLKLLEYDYLGGHGTRGYGRVAFKAAKASKAAGELDDTLLDELNSKLAELGQ